MSFPSRSAHREDGHPPNALIQLSLSALSPGLSSHVGLRKGVFVSIVYGLSGNVRRIKKALMRLHSILECEVPIHFLFLFLKLMPFHKELTKTIHQFVPPLYIIMDFVLFKVSLFFEYLFLKLRTDKEASPFL